MPITTGDHAYFQNLLHYLLMERDPIHRGNSVKDRELAADNSHRMRKREPVRVFVGFQDRFMHQSTDVEVSTHEAIKLVPDQVRRRTKKNDASAPQVGFQFVQGRLNLPTFIIQDCQIMRKSLFRVEEAGEQALERFRPRHAFQPILVSLNRHAVSAALVIIIRRLNVTKVQAVGQAFFAGQAKILFNPPKQLGPLNQRLLPKFETKEITIRQAHHFWLQPGQHSFALGQFPRSLVSHLAAKQHVDTVFHQRGDHD
jgi:hypothetical protein